MFHYESMTLNALIAFLSEDVRLNPHHGDLTVFAQNGGEIKGMGFGASHGGISLTHDFYPEVNERSQWDTFAAMLKVARIEVINHIELPNNYWPIPYVQLRAENPWWLVQTPFGFIKMGWRKRVISIEWDATPVRAIVTEDNVTKSETMVHAWTEDKFIEYMRCWLIQAVEQEAGNKSPAKA